tara:strand:- start:430 stop:684 length:255 start_codon:yes stop_codon:yes gene_type:complete
MSVKLYKLVDNEVVSEQADPLNVTFMLDDGYATCPKKLITKEVIDTNDSGKLSYSEIVAAAKIAGIKTGGKSGKKLKEELGYVE